jgi:hypothetical protein
MKKRYTLILVIVFLIFIAIWIYSVLNTYFGPLIPPCPSDKITGTECTGPIAGSKYICYEPMEDAGKECNTASECKGSCVVQTIEQCEQVTELPLLAICNSNIKGKCSPARTYESDNNLLNYSDSSYHGWSSLFDRYNITQDKKIIIKEIMICA